MEEREKVCEVITGKKGGGRQFKSSQRVESIQEPEKKGDAAVEPLKTPRSSLADVPVRARKYCQLLSDVVVKAVL